MRGIIAVLVAAGIVAIDQFVKQFAVRTLQGTSGRPLIPGLVRLTYVENRGAAFGMLENARVFFIITTLAVLGALLFVLFSGRIWHPLGLVAVTMVMGGAAGNFIDRVRQGYVVDMFEFTFVRFAIFNVADIFLTVGGALLCLYLLLDGQNADVASRSRG